MDAVGLKAIGAGLVMIGAIGPGIGIGLIGLGATLGIARNPQAGGAIQSVAILLSVLTEAISIYCLLIGLVITFIL